MIEFESIKFKNFLSYGNYWTSIGLNDNKTSVVIGSNGNGKCFCINTPIRIRNSITGEIMEITVGDLYENSRKIEEI